MRLLETIADAILVHARSRPVPVPRTSRAAAELPDALPGYLSLCRVARTERDAREIRARDVPLVSPAATR